MSSLPVLPDAELELKLQFGLSLKRGLELAPVLKACERVGDELMCSSGIAGGAVEGGGGGLGNRGDDCGRSMISVDMAQSHGDGR